LVISASLVYVFHPVTLILKNEQMAVMGVVPTFIYIRLRFVVAMLVLSKVYKIILWDLIIEKLK
jgi:hypothetical protein